MNSFIPIPRIPVEIESGDPAFRSSFLRSDSRVHDGSCFFLSLSNSIQRHPAHRRDGKTLNIATSEPRMTLTSRRLRLDLLQRRRRDSQRCQTVKRRSALHLTYIVCPIVTFEIIQGKSRRRNPPSVPYSCSRVQKSFLFLVYYTRPLPPPPLLLLLRLRSKTIQQHQPLGYYTITTTAHYHPTREIEREKRDRERG